MAERVVFPLDTSAPLAHYRTEAGGAEVQGLFEDPDAALVIAGITLTELARRAKELGASLSTVSHVVATYSALCTEIIPIGPAIAKDAFEVGCETPLRLPLADALIAACARSRGAVLVHRDDHMRAIPARVVAQRDLAVTESLQP
ncbi:MAG: type II toxin-antitoxin system VapC family toxin [Armatimonadetes bacterium]|nr:type II toxin-antitoxin system VapC family toxin [Armatimonadota bacterium]